MMLENKKISILLADDDKDDIFFFARALKKVDIATKITSVEDGEKLLDQLLVKKMVCRIYFFLILTCPAKRV